jgi:hypothetical protein
MVTKIFDRILPKKAQKEEKSVAKSDDSKMKKFSRESVD